MPKNNPPKTSKPLITKKPPKDSDITQNKQFELFTQYVANDESTVSNSIELWESIPKYFLTPAQVKKIRTPDGLAEPYLWKYRYNNVPMEIKITPAYLKQANGKYIAYFPGVTEELIEEALKKILADQNNGIHLPESRDNIHEPETWVKFTLYMIKKELTRNNHSRNITEIKQAIDVMSESVITVTENNKQIWRGTILQDLVPINKEDYINNPSAMHIARLPLFISIAINQLKYRQYNYAHHLQCRNQLSRWIYRHLVNRYTYASPDKTYHFMYSEVLNSGLLQQKSARDNRKKMIATLDELKKIGVISYYRLKNIKIGNKIVDIKYTLSATKRLACEQKAANKRQALQKCG